MVYTQNNKYRPALHASTTAQFFMVIFVALTTFSLFFGTIDAQKCNRTPEGHGAMKTPADGRFHIRIAENTARYTPGLKYTSSLLKYYY